MYVFFCYICFMQNSKLYKGSLQTIVLNLLEKKDKMYGYQIIKEIEELTNGSFKLTEGALYPTLHKLEEQGFLEITFSKVDGRTRKYYNLTDNGKKETVSKTEELFEYMKEMQALLSLKLT